LSAYIKVKEKPYIKLGDVVEVLTDYHANGSYEILNKQVQIVDSVDYAYMVRSTDLEKQDCTNNVKYVSKQAYEFLKKTTIVGGELLINKIGSPGRCYLMPILNKPVTLGMNLFMIRLKDTSKINNYFLWTYFNSSLGQKIIYRKVNGTVPMTIDKEAVRSLYVPILNQEFQFFIETTIKKSEASLNQSQELYQQAERMLLDELGLADFTPSTEAVSIKGFAESFGSTGRLDAEYYQPKYDDLLGRIQNYEVVSLNKLVSKYSTGFPYESELYQDEGIPLIRISNIKKGILDTENTAFLSESYALISPKDLARNGDIVISLSGTIGNCALIGETISKCCINQRILSITTHSVIRNYLVLLLNSVVGELQFQRLGVGSVQTNISPKDVLEIKVPILPIPTQQRIADLVERSFTLKAQSEALLAIAKRGVELAIESDEASAQAWMLEQSGGLLASHDV
jgi:type I restriction enzyme S subunit